MDNVAMCPDCEVLITVPIPVRLGKRFECPECGAELEVINLDPLELDFMYDEGEWIEDEPDEFDEGELWGEEDEVDYEDLEDDEEFADEDDDLYALDDE